MKEVTWEIVAHIANQLPQEGDVADLSTVQDMKLSRQEEYVREVLKDYEFTEEYMDPETGIMKTRTVKWDPESLIKQVFDESNKIITQNAKGDIIPDYKARAAVKIRLLESMWVLKKNVPDVKINFLSLLFWHKWD